METGTEIRRLRTARKMTQRQLAAAVGLGVDSVSKHETGAMGVSAEALRSYARVFGCTMDELANAGSAAA